MNEKQCYFASSNSMLGFQSYFDLIYDTNKLKRIYIIKGGPGTGKSSTIRAVGEHFKSEKCEYFLCSSDPSSLDGLIINGEFAIIDGTSPHAIEAKYPGAVETLINNANGMKKGIQKRRNEIVLLNNEKSKLFKGAYAFLKASGEIKKEYVKNISSGIDVGKLDAAISRYFKQNLKRGEGYAEHVRLIEGITPQGRYNTHSFEAQSKRKTIIINGKGYEEIIYKRFIEKAKEYGINTHISFDPLIPFSPNGLLFSELSTCIVNYNESVHGNVDYDKYKVINCERFLDKDTMSNMRSRIRFAGKCSQSLIDEAIHYFSEASKIHKELESIYYEYTDFGCVDENTYNIINEIKDNLRHE